MSNPRIPLINLEQQVQTRSYTNPPGPSTSSISINTTSEETVAGTIRRGDGTRPTSPVPISSVASVSEVASSSTGPERRRKATIQSKDQSAEHVGLRLAKRKDLFQRRKLMADFCLVIAMLGIGLMIVDNELFLNGVYGANKGHMTFFLKTCISASTLLLLGFIVTYHSLNTQIIMIDNGMEDWCLAWSLGKMALLLLELLICAIHPLPVNVEFTWYAPVYHHHPKAEEVNVGPVSTVSTQKPKDTSNIPLSIPFSIPFSIPQTQPTQRLERISLDLILSLPMFLRFYLVCRVLMLHSRLFQDASAQSLGALNRINFNFRFIFKTLMNLHPEHVLIVLISFLFLTFSWALRACEINHEQLQKNFFNSMWLIAITFLSIGYGDMVPITYCGRAIAVVTGMCGAGCTALVVAVLARKLQLTNAEKYVHNFVVEVELNKRLKHASANVLREGWLAYKHRRLAGGSRSRGLLHERRLVRAVREARELRNEKRRMNDNAISLVELHRAQNTTDTMLGDLGLVLKDLSTRVSKLDEKLDRLLSRDARHSQRE